MKIIAAVTTARSDYGCLKPVLRQIQAHTDLELKLIVAGMHLSPEFGCTVDCIEHDGFPIHDRIEMLVSSDTPEGTAISMGLGMMGFAHCYAKLRPDILLVLGDRFEVHAAVAAAVSFRIPVAHIAGGETTRGAIDELFRHSITKMSHLHFVSTEEYARRVIQMGEAPWRVHVTGAPSLDQLHTLQLLPKESIAKQLDLLLAQAPLLVTLHPETQSLETTEAHTRSVLQALDRFDTPIVVSYPNADTSGRSMIEQIKVWATQKINCRLVPNLGNQLYFSLMSIAAAMVGNSSSGIVEATSFHLPVVNIGTRQDGRLHPANVIDTPFITAEIASAISLSMSDAFRAKIANVKNPFGDGNSAQRIVSTLAAVKLNRKLLVKNFYDCDFDPTSNQAGL
jgi:UDP-hydrolysing UDP-N-acetyl-D-glucosamine 2-epimerase